MLEGGWFQNRYCPNKLEKDIKMWVFKKPKTNIAKSVIFKTKGFILIDETAEIKEGCILQNGPNEKIIIGKYVQLNPYCVLYGGNITIKDNCMIAPHVVITTANHDFIQTEVPMRFAGVVNKADLIIEADVWVGGKVSIIAGSKHIGKGAVVGANSVVNKPVPDYAIVAGVPAKIIGYRKNKNPTD